MTRILANCCLSGLLVVLHAQFATAEAPSVVSEQTEADVQLSPIKPLSQLLTKTLNVSGAKVPYRLQDVAIDLEEGRVALAMLGRANSSTAESEQSLIPWSSVGFAEPAGLTVNLRHDELSRDFAQSVEELGRRPTRARLAKLSQQLKQLPYWAERIAAATWGSGSKYEQLFDREKLRDVVGKVVRVETVTPLQGMAPGTQVTIATDTGSVQVQLGPRWFLKQQDLRLHEGDEVKVTGAEIQSGNAPAIMAINIRMGDRQLVLRHDDGKAIWRNWDERDEQYGLVLWSQLKGMAVHNDEGQTLGKVADLAIALPSGTVAYVAISGGDLPNDMLRPVPLSAFVVDPKTEEWTLELPADVVANIKTFRSDQWPDKIDGGWLEYLHVRYGRPLFGGVQSQPHQAKHDK
jgi:sporulation protein YlmC with PRC-barrel domain